MISINYYLKDIPSEKNIQELLKTDKPGTNKLLDKSRYILMLINQPGNRKRYIPIGKLPSGNGIKTSKKSIAGKCLPVEMKSMNFSSILKKGGRNIA